MQIPIIAVASCALQKPQESSQKHRMRGHRLIMRDLRVAIQAGSEGWLGGLALGVGSDCEGGGGLLWRGQ